MVEEELYGAVVVGEGHLHIAATGKHDEGDAVAAQGGEQVVDGALAAFQAVGLDVLSHHAVGDVETDGDVAADAFTFYHFAAFLRVGQGKDEEGGSQHDESEFEGGTPAGSIGDEAAEHVAVGKLGKTLFAPQQEPYPEPYEEGNEKQCPKYLWMFEMYHVFIVFIS